jgi:hypothetical protein
MANVMGSGGLHVALDEKATTRVGRCMLYPLSYRAFGVTVMPRAGVEPATVYSHQHSWQEEEEATRW